MWNFYFSKRTHWLSLCRLIGGKPGTPDSDPLRRQEVLPSTQSFVLCFKHSFWPRWTWLTGKSVSLASFRGEAEGRKSNNLSHFGAFFDSFWSTCWEEWNKSPKRCSHKGKKSFLISLRRLFEPHEWGFLLRFAAQIHFFCFVLWLVGKWQGFRGRNFALSFDLLNPGRFFPSFIFLSSLCLFAPLRLLINWMNLNVT